MFEFKYVNGDTSTSVEVKSNDTKLVQAIFDLVTKQQAEKTFGVYIENFGKDKIPMIKAVREITYLGLKEAKDVVEKLNKGLVKNGLTIERAEEIRASLVKSSKDCCVTILPD